MGGFVFGLFDDLSCSGSSVSLPKFSSALSSASPFSSSEEEDFSFSKEELEESRVEDSSCFDPDEESSPQAINVHAKTRQRKNSNLFIEPPLFGMLNITLFI